MTNPSDFYPLKGQQYSTSGLMSLAELEGLRQECLAQ